MTKKSDIWRKKIEKWFQNALISKNLTQNGSFKNGSNVSLWVMTPLCHINLYWGAISHTYKQTDSSFIMFVRKDKVECSIKLLLRKETDTFRNTHTKVNRTHLDMNLFVWMPALDWRKVGVPFFRDLASRGIDKT